MKEPVVNIFGEPHELKAEVVVLNSFSGHADRNEILSYLHHFDTKKMKSAFLVHGDVDQSEKLREGMREAGFSRVGIPARGEKAVID